MNTDTTIKIRDKWIEISGHRGLSPDVQGETGLVFTKPTISQAVTDYVELIKVAPYYRVMLDSHVKLNEAKHADIAGLLTDVWTDSDGAARLNYVVFNNTPVFDRVATMAAAGAIGFASLSTRGYGKHIEIKPSRVVSAKTSTKIRMLHDSPVKYFKTLGEAKYKKGGVYCEGFILLGWDIVVAPSQNDASSIFFFGNQQTAMVKESGGIIRKAFGDKRIIKDHLVSELQLCTGSQCFEPVAEAAISLSMEYSPIVPPLRTYLTVPQDHAGELTDRLGSSVADMLKRWI